MSHWPPDVSQRMLRASEQLLGEAIILADEVGDGVGPLDLLASLTVSLAAQRGHLDELIAGIQRVQSGESRPVGGMRPR